MQDKKLEIRVGLFIIAALALFMYMAFNIGAFRFNTGQYAPYSLLFSDVSGLSKKAEVKIAGVAIGWIDNLTFAPHHGKAQADIMIRKEYQLHDDAYGIIRQDGLLGGKYIELVPGDPLAPMRQPGQAAPLRGVEPVGLDEVMQRCKKIATHVESISAVLDRSFAGNEMSIENFLQVGNDIRQLAHKCETEILPSLRESMERIAGSFDRDLSKMGSTAQALEEASVQARDGLRNVASIAQKIESGQGTIGKLVCEDETYRDLKVAIQGLKNYFAQIDRLQVVLDGHTEWMSRTAEHYDREDVKGFIDARIHPSEDHFYVVQLSSSLHGYKYEYNHRRQFFDQQCHEYNQEAMDLTPQGKLWFAPSVDHSVFERNAFKLGVQFGKIFQDIAVRIGLIEGLTGFGLDLEVPLHNKNLRWVTTFEAYDLVGWNRIDDRRPHLKWLNRMFFFDNLYVTFGADDFISKHNGSVFFGGGMRWGDDDVKYIISGLATGIASITNQTIPPAFD